MPSLEKLQRKYTSKKFTVLHVNVKEEKSHVRAFMKDHGYSFPVLLDRQGVVSEAYSIFAHPAAIIIDKQGKIVARSMGFQDWSAKQNQTIIEVLIAE